MPKKTKSALIFGISGQDGYYLSKLLIQKKYKVYGVIRKNNSATKKNYFWRLNNIKKNIIFHKIQIRDYKQIANLIKKLKPTEIYHLASQSFINLDFESEFFNFNPNINGTYYILSSIKKYSPKSKFYFAASSELFGNTDVSPQNEKTRFNPRSAYGISKLAGYQLTRNYREAYKIFACSGILFNHESPLRDIRFVSKKIANSVARIKLGLQKNIYLGNIDSLRDWGHAYDYTHAMWLMLQAKKPQDYVIGTGKLHSVRDIVKLAFAKVGLNYLRYIKINKKLIRPLEKKNLCANFSKAKKILKWKPKISFKDLVKEMLNHEINLLK